MGNTRSYICSVTTCWRKMSIGMDALAINPVYIRIVFAVDNMYFLQSPTSLILKSFLISWEPWIATGLVTTYPWEIRRIQMFYEKPNNKPAMISRLEFVQIVKMFVLQHGSKKFTYTLLTSASSYLIRKGSRRYPTTMLLFVQKGWLLSSLVAPSMSR